MGLPYYVANQPMTDRSNEEIAAFLLALDNDPTTAAAELAAIVATCTGLENDYTLTNDRTFTAYSGSMIYTFTPSSTNSDAVTVNVNGLGVVPLVQGDGRALVANDLNPDMTVNIIYCEDKQCFYMITQDMSVPPAVAAIVGTGTGTGVITSIPSTATIGGVLAANIVLATVNFNNRNDRLGTAISAPTGLVLAKADKSVGTVDLSLQWTWSGNENDIDGFAIYVHTATSNASWTLGDPTDIIYPVLPHSRQFIGLSIAADLWYTIGVRAYRVVDKDIAASSVIASSISQLAAYQPNANPNYTANINGVAASIVQSYASGAYTGTILYRSAGAPTNNPSPTGATITMNSVGGRDIRLDWGAYTQGALQADGLLLFIKEGSGTPTVADAAFQFNITSSASYHIFQNVDASKAYTAGIAAFRRTENGVEIGTIIGHPTWVISAGTPNITANINGVAASIVQSYASGAYTGTILYRSSGAPTNNPTPVSATVTQNSIGGRDIRVDWGGYTQGTLQADGLLLFVKEGVGTPTVADAAFQFNITSSASYHIFQNVDSTKTYTAGIAAFRRTENGVEIGAIQTTASWSIAAGTANITANINGVAASIVQSYASGAYTGTVNYRTSGVPTNNPTPVSATVTQNSIGGRDIRVDWGGYTQGALQADGLLLFIKEGTGTPTVTDAAFQFNITSSASYHIFQNVDTTKTYTAGIAAFRRTENGVEIGTIQTTASWAISSGTANFTANINGVAASIVQSYASGAYTGTILYRTTGAPTYDPVPNSANVAPNSFGGRDITVIWNGYTQGALQADGLLLFVKSGTGTPSLTDISYQFNVTSSASYHTFWNVDASQAYTYGIAAFRRTENGVEIGAIKTNVAWAIAAGTPSNIPSSGSVTSGTIASGAVGSTALSSGAVTPAKTAIAAIDSTTGNLTANSVSTSNIQTNAVQALNIAGGAVTAAKTALAAINSSTGNLTANSVTAANIVAGTITGVQIAANTITAANMNVANLAAINANLGTVTAGSITGTSGITITGQAVFNGTYSVSGVNYAVVAGNSVSQAGGVWGYGTSNGVFGSSSNTGVKGDSSGVGGYGIMGQSSGTSGTGVYGYTSASYNSTVAVRGDSTGGIGGRFETFAPYGYGTYAVYANAANDNTGVAASSSSGNGIYGRTYGSSPSVYGVTGVAPSGGTGVYGENTYAYNSGYGVKGYSINGYAIYGNSVNNHCIVGQTTGNGWAIVGFGDGTYSGGLYGSCVNNIALSGVATGASGTGVRCHNSAGGVGLSIDSGRMVIANTTLVANLNADMVDGLHAGSMCQLLGTSSGNATPYGGSMYFTSSVSGTATRTTDAQTVNVYSVSDARIKQNIQREKLGSDFIRKLKPKTYELKSTPGRTVHGFIAQDMRAIIGDIGDCLFEKHDNGLLGTDYVALISPIVVTLQEILKRLDALEGSDHGE